MTGGFFAILDDIAMLLDDTAAMTKIAAKKTAGVLGDDLAVNAEKAAGFSASRELPVLWAISKGSVLNKIIILPFAFLLSAFMPWLIVPLLLLGGVYLCYEGMEKIVEWLFHRHVHEIDKVKVREASADTMVTVERGKIKSAILTDFILSMEIIVIALGTVMDKHIGVQLVVVSIIALLATVGVYGLVALIVRMDDVGLWLVQQSARTSGAGRAVLNALGTHLISAMPRLIQALSIIGTLAMLLVGGGMFVHNVDMVHHSVEHWHVPIIAAELLLGLLVGSLALAVMTSAHWLMGNQTQH